MIDRREGYCEGRRALECYRYATPEMMLARHQITTDSPYGQYCTVLRTAAAITPEPGQAFPHPLPRLPQTAPSHSHAMNDASVKTWKSGLLYFTPYIARSARIIVRSCTTAAARAIVSALSLTVTQASHSRGWRGWAGLGWAACMCSAVQCICLGAALGPKAWAWMGRGLQCRRRECNAMEWELNWRLMSIDGLSWQIL